MSHDMGLFLPNFPLSLRGALARRGNPPIPSPGEKVAERKRGRKWNAGGNVG